MTHFGRSSKSSVISCGQPQCNSHSRTEAGWDLMLMSPMQEGFCRRNWLSHVAEFSQEAVDQKSHWLPVSLPSSSFRLKGQIRYSTVYLLGDASRRLSHDPKFLGTSKDFRTLPNTLLIILDLVYPVHHLTQRCGCGTWPWTGVCAYKRSQSTKNQSTV